MYRTASKRAARVLEINKQVSHYDSGQLVAIFLRIPADRIVELNFLLESYDGLGIVRTLDAGHGEVVVLATRELQDTVFDFISHIAADLDVQVIGAPASVANDWLLAAN